MSEVIKEKVDLTPEQVERIFPGVKAKEGPVYLVKVFFDTVLQFNTEKGVVNRDIKLYKGKDGEICVRRDGHNDLRLMTPTEMGLDETATRPIPWPK
tara:strand:- start:117 stop:407 length:291 start_codon:yes stop_codon:yes gene_type:complete